MLLSVSSTASSSHSRSASQPRASQSHFLDGFNVADCFDVRSIPDPPSPQQQQSRRRLSTPLMNPKPSLEDVTNQGSHKDIDDLGATKAHDSGTRKRKTLAHVSCPLTSPMVMDQRDDPVAREQGREENNNMEVRPKRLQVRLCLDDNEEEEFGGNRSRGSPKRRKKRQSIVIPSQVSLNDDDAAFLETSSFPHGRSPDAKDSSHQIKRLFPGDLKSLKELRKLVHGYCDLSQEKRVSSKEAKIIRETTGYALLDAAPDAFVNYGTSSQAILANRRLVLQKLSPVMMQMEKRKGRETRQWERDTGCRVEKSNRSGKYKYVCIQSNQKVGTQEYKRRYMWVIQGREDARKAWTRTWMNKLDETITVEDESKEENPTAFLMIDASTVEQGEPNEPPGLEAPIQDGTIFRNDYSDNEARQREDFLPPVSNLSRSSSTASQRSDVDAMELCDKSESLDYGEQASALEITNVIAFSTTSALSTTMIIIPDSEREGPAEITEASSEDTDESLDSRSSSPDLMAGSNVMAVDDFVAVNQTEGTVLTDHLALDADYEPYISAAQTPTPLYEEAGATPLLPFPDRDMESVDPDIAQAERGLWDKIDLALQEYSEEVMMIMKSKQTGDGEPSTSTPTAM